MQGLAASSAGVADQRRSRKRTWATATAKAISGGSRSAPSGSSTATSGRRRCTRSKSASRFPTASRPVADNVLGILSLVFWSLTLVVSIKYLAFVMRADNDGEGGVLALLALVAAPRAARAAQRRRRRHLLLMLGLFGAALLYGDGVITPAISVLSAVEGLEVATTACAPYVVPITCVILVALFAIQRRGTGGIGAVFGPVTLVWFVAIAALGLALDRARTRRSCARVNPIYGAALLRAARAPRLPGARLGRPVRHRRRGALRRHGPLRPARDPHRLGRCASSRRCSSTTSARARCCSSTRPPPARTRSTRWCRRRCCSRWCCSRRPPPWSRRRR